MKNMTGFARTMLVLSIGLFLGQWYAEATGEENEYDDGPAFPAGAVITFTNASQCPKGWTSYKPAEGRVVLGHSNNSIFGNVGDYGELITGEGVVTSPKGVITPQELISVFVQNKTTLNYVVLRHCVVSGSQKPKEH